MIGMEKWIRIDEDFMRKSYMFFPAQDRLYINICFFVYIRPWFQPKQFHQRNRSDSRFRQVLSRFRHPNLVILMGFARHAESGSIEGGGCFFFVVVAAAVVTEQKSIFLSFLALHVDHCNSESSFFSIF